MGRLHRAGKLIHRPRRRDYIVQPPNGLTWVPGRAVDGAIGHSCEGQRGGEQRDFGALPAANAGGAIIPTVPKAPAADTAPAKSPPATPPPMPACTSGCSRPRRSSKFEVDPAATARRYLARELGAVRRPAPGKLKLAVSPDRSYRQPERLAIVRAGPRA
jgi:hypothetical protein